MFFGINTFLFVSPFTDEWVDFFPKFRSWEFDFVEIALEEPTNIDPMVVRGAKVREIAKAAVLWRMTNPLSEETARKGLHFLKQTFSNPDSVLA